MLDSIMCGPREKLKNVTRGAVYTHIILYRGDGTYKIYIHIPGMYMVYMGA